ncbi:hypothetical protein TNCV_3760971 [Trichonephila clavipes]|nr:hypothetical protein TNCV_3760971 [Trichonephila clavipes]
MHSLKTSDSHADSSKPNLLTAKWEEKRYLLEPSVPDENPLGNIHISANSRHSTAVGDTPTILEEDAVWLQVQVHAVNESQQTKKTCDQSPSYH